MRAIRVAAVLALSLLAVYLGVGAWLWAIQDRFVFPALPDLPRSALDEVAAELGGVPVDLVAEDGTRLYGWHVPSDGRRLVLFLHGSRTGLPFYRALFEQLDARGWDVLAISYRGYPGSAGTPSEAGLGLDARAAWAWALQSGFDPRSVVVHGRSLGGGVAAELVAGGAEPAGLVLESTFGSVRDLAASRLPVYPMGLLLRSPFDTERLAPRIRVPVLILHSRDDRGIPVELGGRALDAAIDGAEYLERVGFGHQDCLTMVDPDSQRAYHAALERWVPRRTHADPED